MLNQIRIRYCLGININQLLLLLIVVLLPYLRMIDVRSILGYSYCNIEFEAALCYLCMRASHEQISSKWKPSFKILILAGNMT